MINSYKPPKNLLKDRVILITGAGRGIGAICAICYAKYGAKIALLGKNITNLEKVATTIQELGYAAATIFPLDLANRDEGVYDNLAIAIEKSMGRLHGIVHNASILGKLGPIDQYNAVLWEQVMQINMNSTFLLTKACLPLLRESATSSIIFTSSGVGNQGRAHWGAYSVSKFAIEGFAQILADEEKGVSKVRINTINPGAMRTQMRASAYPAEDPQTLPTPEEIMPLYLYLMGDDSEHLTGQRINAAKW